MKNSKNEEMDINVFSMQIKKDISEKVLDSNSQSAQINDLKLKADESLSQNILSIGKVLQRPPQIIEGYPENGDPFEEVTAVLTERVVVEKEIYTEKQTIIFSKDQTLNTIVKNDQTVSTDEKNSIGKNFETKSVFDVNANLEKDLLGDDKIEEIQVKKNFINTKNGNYLKKTVIDPYITDLNKDDESSKQITKISEDSKNLLLSDPYPETGGMKKLSGEIKPKKSFGDIIVEKEKIARVNSKEISDDVIKKIEHSHHIFTGTTNFNEKNQIEFSPIKKSLRSKEKIIEKNDKGRYGNDILNVELSEKMITSQLQSPPGAESPKMSERNLKQISEPMALDAESDMRNSTLYGSFLNRGDFLPDNLLQSTDFREGINLDRSELGSPFSALNKSRLLNDLSVQKNTNFAFEKFDARISSIMKKGFSEEAELPLEKAKKKATDAIKLNTYLFDKTFLANNPKTALNFKLSNNTKIFTSCVLKNPSNVLISHAVICPHTVLRADLATLKIDQYSIICDEVVIHPPLNKNFDFCPISIGKYSIIGPKSVVKAISIGNCVRIGRNCILEDNVVIESNSIILDNSILPAETFVPGGCVFGGRPAVFIETVSSCLANHHVLEAISYYNSLVSEK